MTSFCNKKFWKGKTQRLHIYLFVTRTVEFDILTTIYSYILEAEVVVNIYNLLSTSFDSLKPHEKYLVETQITELNSDLSKGLTSLSWSSQRISSFLTDLKSKINDISSFADRVRISLQHLDSTITKFTTFSVVHLPSDCDGASYDINTNFISNECMQAQYLEIKNAFFQLKGIMGDSKYELKEKHIPLNKFYQEKIFQAQSQIAIRSLLRWNFVFKIQSKLVQESDSVQPTEVNLQTGINEIFSSFDTMEPWKDFNCGTTDCREDILISEALANEQSVSVVLNALSMRSS